MLLLTQMVEEECFNLSNSGKEIMANRTLQKLEWENTTRLLYFKHRGDLSGVLKDLRTKYGNEVDNVNERITATFVEKVIKKFKKEQKVNSPFVATWILDYVFMGTKQREVLWDADDSELAQYKFGYRSACCDAAAQLCPNDRDEIIFTCLKCDRICNAYRVPNLEVFETLRKLRVEKRKDEEQIVKSADSLGFGGEKPPMVKQTVNQVVLGDGNSNRKHVKSLVKGDQQIVEDLKLLPSMDKEVVIGRLRQNLEKIEDGDSEEK